MVKIEGRCPACGKDTLFLGEGGYVTCSMLGCPIPDAATRVLEDRALREVLMEAVAQDRKVADDPPGLWTPHRQGVRSHIAAIEDEVREAREAWDQEKKPAGPADAGRWPLTRAELIQATAAGLRAVRELSPEPATGVGGSDLMAETAAAAAAAPAPAISALGDFAAANEGSLAISFGLGRRGGRLWSVALTWGREAADSPKEGAQALGVAGTLEEALAQVLAEARVELLPVPDPEAIVASLTAHIDGALPPGIGRGDLAFEIARGLENYGIDQVPVEGDEGVSS